MAEDRGNKSCLFPLSVICFARHKFVSLAVQYNVRWHLAADFSTHGYALITGLLRRYAPCSDAYITQHVFAKALA
ncbi:MAG: hypothetical protein LBP63_06765 [Prevotellaceae bacterium]|nr:hypothetical protein [Prevotellaceae bacterium]